MKDLQDPPERTFHLVMFVLLAFSLIADQQELAFWRTGKVGIVSMVFALVWLGRFAMEGFRRRDSELKILRNRIDELEERADELERDARSRRGPL